MLDVGVGSGVLSIVAYKLGAASILATDIDPIAVEVTQENAVAERRTACRAASHNHGAGYHRAAWQRAGSHAWPL